MLTLTNIILYCFGNPSHGNQRRKRNKGKCKKAKWLFEETSQTAEERKEAKTKGENESYSDLNAKFQRRARRDKRVIFSEQCKEIEENNRIGKIGELFKKIENSKGTFHAMMGTIKGRKDKDLTETEEINTRWQEYREELYKKGLNNLDNHHSVVTHQQPDILLGEVK